MVEMVDSVDTAPATPSDSVPTHEKLIVAFARELRRRDPDGTAVARVDDVDRMARTIAATAIDTAAIWHEVLGPVYDTETVAELLGGGRAVSRQAVSKRALLALRTGSGRVVYPAFQFDESGAVITGVAEVVRIMATTSLSSWTLAAWFVSPEPDLSGERPIDALRAGGHQVVCAAARAWAAAL